MSRKYWTVFISNWGYDLMRMYDKNFLVDQATCRRRLWWLGFDSLQKAQTRVDRLIRMFAEQFQADQPNPKALPGIPAPWLPYVVLPTPGPAKHPFHVAVPFENQYQRMTCKQCGFPVDDVIHSVEVQRADHQSSSDRDQD